MHPLMACFNSHRLHIVSKWERWYINVLLIALALSLAAWTTEAQQCYLYQGDYGYCDLADGASTSDPEIVLTPVETRRAGTRPKTTLRGIKNKGHGNYEVGGVIYNKRGGTQRIGGKNYTYAFKNRTVYRTKDDAKARIRFDKSGFDKVADAPPADDSCCLVDTIGFIDIYASGGGYALSAANAAITILFAQICFQSAACGCAQRWSDDCKWRCESLGHVWLLVCGAFALWPVAACCTYISENGLWATTIYSFVLTKGGSMCGAFVLMTLLWHILYTLQSGPEREGRFGSDGKFFIQFDDEDVQQYWKEHPGRLPSSSSLFSSAAFAILLYP